MLNVIGELYRFTDTVAAKISSSLLSLTYPRVCQSYEFICTVLTRGRKGECKNWPSLCHCLCLAPSPSFTLILPSCYHLFGVLQKVIITCDQVLVLQNVFVSKSPPAILLRNPWQWNRKWVYQNLVRPKNSSRFLGLNYEKMKNVISCSYIWLLLKCNILKLHLSLVFQKCTYKKRYYCSSWGKRLLPRILSNIFASLWRQPES